MPANGTRRARLVILPSPSAALVLGSALFFCLGLMPWPFSQFNNGCCSSSGYSDCSQDIYIHTNRVPAISFVVDVHCHHPVFFFFACSSWLSCVCCACLLPSIFLARTYSVAVFLYKEVSSLLVSHCSLYISPSSPLCFLPGISLSKHGCSCVTAEACLSP